MKVILGYTGPELAAFGELLSSCEPAVYRLAPWTQDDADRVPARDRSHSLCLGDGPTEGVPRLLVPRRHPGSLPRPSSTGWRADESIAGPRPALRVEIWRIGVSAPGSYRAGAHRGDRLLRDSRHARDEPGLVVVEFLSICGSPPEGAFVASSAIAPRPFYWPPIGSPRSSRTASPELVLAGPYPSELVLEVASDRGQPRGDWASERVDR